MCSRLIFPYHSYVPGRHYILWQIEQDLKLDKAILCEVSEH